MSEERKAPKIQLQVDDETAQGRYANFVVINHSENEFLLDFAFLQPNTGRAKVFTRVISSPRHTKRFLMTLQKNLQRFEERFGAIDVGSVAGDEPIVH